MASFAGVTIKIRGSGTTFPRWRRKADSTVTHIPGGNTSVYQTSGNSADTLTLPLKLTEAQLTSLYGKVGASGTLDLDWGSRTAILDEISNVDEILADRDVFLATCTFIGR